MLTRAADSAQQFHSVQFRQHEVEQHHVVGVRFREKQSFLAIGGDIHGVAGALPQAAGNVLGQPDFILNH